jgi:hypothetical protein
MGRWDYLFTISNGIMDVYGIINGFMMVELVDMASPMIPSAGCWNFVVLGCRHLAG